MYATLNNNQAFLVAAGRQSIEPQGSLHNNPRGKSLEDVTSFLAENQMNTAGEVSQASFGIATRLPTGS